VAQDSFRGGTGKNLAVPMTLPLHRRVSLRPWAPGDRGFLVELMTDPEVRRYLGGAVDTDVAKERSERCTAPAPWGYFVIELDGVPVGTVTYDRKRGPWEVSFQLERGSWGRGVMSVALTHAVEWFRAIEPRTALIAVTQRENVAARTAIVRAGGRAESEFEHYGARQIQYVFAPASTTDVSAGGIDGSGSLECS